MLSLARKKVFGSAVSAAIRTLSVSASSGAPQAPPFEAAPFSEAPPPSEARPLKTSEVNSCVIRGFNNDIYFSDDIFEPLDEFAKKCPPLVAIQQSRLIKVDTNRQFQLAEGWHHILRTAFLHSYICKVNGENIVGAYESSNVGIIKRGIDVFGFKKFARSKDEDGASSGHSEFLTFVDEFLAKHHGTSAINHLPEWMDFVQTIKLGNHEDLLDDPFFLKDESAAALFFYIHKLLRHELHSRGWSDEVKDIMFELNSDLSYSQTLLESRRHFLLKHLHGIHSKKNVIYHHGIQTIITRANQVY